MDIYRQARTKQEQLDPMETTTYLIPEDQKEFWGTEFLNFEGALTHEMAVQRIRAYTDVQKLRGDQEFKLDSKLKEILKTDREYMLLCEIKGYLKHMTTLPLKTMDGAKEKWCPATGKEQHAYGKTYHVGNSWHGPVWGANCTKCGYRYTDH